MRTITLRMVLTTMLAFLMFGTVFPAGAQEATPETTEAAEPTSPSEPSATLEPTAPTEPVETVVPTEPAEPTEIAAPTASPENSPAVRSLADEAVAPTLLLNGQAQPAIVDLGVDVAVDTNPAGMMVLSYEGHGCTGTVVLSLMAPWSFTKAQAYEGSLRAYNINDPDQRTPCLDVTWRPAPVELLLNGQAASQTAEIGTTIAVTTTPTNLMVLVYDGYGCTGAATSSHQAPWSYTMPAPHQASLRAYDVQNPDRRTACLDATWRQEAVKLLLNGASAPATVTLDTVVNATTSPSGMTISRFTGHDCNPANKTGEWADNYHELSPSPLQVSFQGTDPAGVMQPSPCLNATWVPAPVQVLLNGQASSLMVRENTPVLVRTSPAGLWVNVYQGPGCQQLRQGRTENFTLNSRDPDHLSLQAVNPQYPNFPSECLNLTWNSGLLPLALNDQENDLRVVVDQQVTVTTLPNLPVRIVSYSGHGCLPANEVESKTASTITVTSSTVGETSVRAFFDDPTPEYDPSPCRNLTWDPLEIRLTVNNRTSGLVFPNRPNYIFRAPNIEVRFSAPNDPARTIVAALYSGQTCTGEPTRVVRSEDLSHARLFDYDIVPAATFWAIQAFDPDHATHRSACIVVDWGNFSTEEPATPDPSSTVTPDPSGPVATTPASQADGSLVSSLPATGSGNSQSQPTASLLLAGSLLLASVLSFLGMARHRRLLR